MVDLLHYLINLLFSDIPLFLFFLYYYINLRPLIVCNLFTGDMYLSSPLVTGSELLCGTFFETLVILSEILLPIKSAASVVF